MSEMPVFQKCKRDAKLLSSGEWREWRLASVDEVNRYLAEIRRKGILNSLDTVRLLDGCVRIKTSAVKQYKPNMEEMLLIKTDRERPSDGSFREDMYSDVKLPRDGGKVAVLLSWDDKITEVICFVLHSIIEEKKVKLAEELNKLTESLQEKFRKRSTVFHCVVDQSHNPNHGKYVANCLMDEFPDGKDFIEAADIYGRTALHFAAFHGNTEVCELLIQKFKVKADKTDINNENVVHFAIKGKQINVLYSLSELPEVRAIIGSPDAQGRTALHKAAAQGAEEMIETLLSNVKKSNLDSKFNISQTNLLGQSERDLDEDEKARRIFIRQPDLFGQTALLEAARGGHVKVVELLLKKGSRPLYERNSDGRSALHYAVQLSNDERAKEMAQLLLEQRRTSGDRPNQERQYLTDDERSLFLWASATGSGTAEEACPKSSPVRKYLEEERERTKQSLESLFTIAINLRHDKIAWELVKRGANTAEIRKCDSIERQRRVDYVLNQVSKINNMAERSGDQPAIFDSLGRKEIAEGLAALFLNPYVKSPLTVGISGEWGMGKSSLMIQTEIILLKTAAQLSFPNLLDTDQFPECRQIFESKKVPQAYEKINKAAKKLLSSSTPASKDDALLQFLDGDYQQKYHEVYRSLALRDRREMFPTIAAEAADSSSNQHSLRKVPSILTVCYNAWHYRNEQEAWSGLAVETTKAIEESMTMAQRVRCRCRYAWREHGSKMFLELLLPILLALFLSIWVMWVVWELLTTSNNKDVQALKYGSIPVTVLVVVWTVVRQLLSVLKPISVQIMGYLQFTNHRLNLGYQHQVISDISFLRDEIGEKPSWRWRFIAWLWTIIAGICRYITWLLLICPNTKKDYSVFKSSPPEKDDIRIIVFIDDLDRCQDKVILQVLSAINLVLVACNINVVLGMDMNMLERVMKGEFPQVDNPKELAQKYIGKMVQLQLALPDPNEEESKRFLEEQLGPAFEEGFTPRDTEEIEPDEQRAGHEHTSADQNGDFLCLKVHQDFTEVSQICMSKLSKINEKVRSFRDTLLGSCSGISLARKEAHRKLANMSFSMQTIMPNYIMEERIALDYLRKRTSGDRRLPRECKRFLIYHRIAWHILSRRKQVQNIEGWQQQLVIWIFFCWQWKDQLDLIIKNWRKLVHLYPSSKDGKESLELNSSSLKNFIEHSYQYIWLPRHHKQEEDEEEEMEKQEKLKEEEQKLEEDEIDEKFQLENEDWLSLLDTFTLYDISVKNVENFQKFRVNCEVGDLAT